MTEPKVEMWSRQTMPAAIKERLDHFTIDTTLENAFYHLCFCVLVPQAKWSSIAPVVDRLKMEDYFHKSIHQGMLEVIVKPSRFYNRKAWYLAQIRANMDNLKFVVDMPCSKIGCTCPKEDSYPIDMVKRDVIMKYKGVGYKVASHFLRNVGCRHLAIIDTHILKFLKAYQVNTDAPYLVLEDKFRAIAETYNLLPAELDLWLWQSYSGVSWDSIVY